MYVPRVGVLMRLCVQFRPISGRTRISRGNLVTVVMTELAASVGNRSLLMDTTFSLFTDLKPRDCFSSRPDMDD